MVFLGIGRYLADARDLARKRVDVLHREVRSRLAGDCQQVKDGIGGASHGDVQGHGVQECRAGGDAARKHGLIVFLIIFARVFDYLPCGFQEELLAEGVSREDCAVAGKCEADGLREAVHGVGCEHAGTAAAGRAGASLYRGDIGVADRRVGGLDHGVDQVEPGTAEYAGFHGASGNEDGGDVEPHGGDEHARSDLVAVADADEGVGLVGVDHVLDAVRDDVAGRERIEHAVVAHGDAVVDGDGVELGRETAQALDLFLHDLARLVQMHVAGDELCKGIGNGDDWLAGLLLFHSVRKPEGPGASHPASLESDTAPEFHNRSTN